MDEHKLLFVYARDLRPFRRAVLLRDAAVVSLDVLSPGEAAAPGLRRRPG